MSVGQDFDPSLLEGKDRAELVAIATSLGQKPPARAKKEAVINLIMELVGAGDSGAGNDGPDAGSDETVEPAPEAAAQADTEAGSDPASAAGSDDSEHDSDGDGDAGTDESDSESDGEADANAGSDGGQGGQGNQQGPRDGDTEPGNRRRRRRGRDRDRRPDDDAPAEPIEVEGLVDLREEGYGFLRLGGYLPTRDDAYISVKQTRQFGLRTGDVVRGKARPANRDEKNPALLQVERVNGHSAHQQPARRRFEELSPQFPTERLRLETDADGAGRVIDVIAPIGKGQRGVILAPPRSGRTELIKQLVAGLRANHPDVEVLVLLVDERPEDAADVERSVGEDVQVAASTFDRPVDEHVSVAELAVERAKRLAEGGADVVLIMDGLTRLVRAYNQVVPGSARQVGGVVDADALHQGKRLLGAARNVPDEGSLTILATMLVDNGARIDQVIVDELLDTANQVVRLRPQPGDGRDAPEIDLDASSTDHEDALLGADAAQVREARARLIAESAKN